MSDNKPCPCWTNRPWLHDGHCCFAHPTHDYHPDEPLPCGHRDEGLAMLRAVEAQRT